jgi:DNA-binding NarL/FixJ family response regulator/tetratricopeptide (TPR) repeat protein
VLDGASDDFAQVVGREPEFAALRGFLDRDAARRSLVLVGEPGIGKTTLWEAGITIARERGLRVLVARPSGAEAELSFAALIDPFDEIDLGALDGLPAPQRLALEVALLRAEPAAVSAEPHAIGLGLLNGLRALAARETVLVAIDDVQWLDRPSADALAFAVRRLERESVGFLVARRPGRRPALERVLERTEFERMEIGPLRLGATRQLLSERLGLSLSRYLLRRIVESTLGNPLFVLEFGRTLVEQGLPAIGNEIPLPDSVEEMLGTRVAGLSDGVRRLLLAVSLSADLRVAELRAIGPTEAVEDAVDAGVLVIDGARVRASHPLLAAVGRKRSRPRERRDLHLVLAGVVADEELRALHAALATVHADPELADTVAHAAASACARGARQEAVALGEHALRLTPAESAERTERLLVLAGYLETAGEVQRLTTVLAPELEALPAGAPRARAWLLLSEGASPKNLDDLERHHDRALAESQDDPGLRAYVLAKKAANTSATGVARIREAEAWASEALQAARRADPDVKRLALYALAWTRALSGRPIDDLCRRARTASDAPEYIAASAERIAGQRRIWRGEVPKARTELTRLLALADERGEPMSYALARLHLCELELRVGDWDAASRLLDEWAESAERELQFRPMYERCRALLAAGLGRAREAERWAAKATRAAAVVGSRWDELEGLRASGIGALLAHEPERAVESLRSVWDHTRREQVDEPGVFPVAPDLVEALTELGALEEARAVTARLQALADQQHHRWATATAQRCAATIRLASDAYDEDAVAALTQAAADYGRLSLRFDRARSLLTLGRAQRRLKKWGAARETLQAAVGAFEELRSDGWAEQARSELARVGARRPAPSGELTPSETRIVELAAAGLSNKEISQTLYVTVHTVEVHLSHAYAKLGVRSRGQLARRISAAG